VGSSIAKHANPTNYETDFMQLRMRCNQQVSR